MTISLVLEYSLALLSPTKKKRRRRRFAFVIFASLKFNFIASKVKLMNYLILKVILFYIMISTKKINKRCNMRISFVDYSYLTFSICLDICCVQYVWRFLRFPFFFFSLLQHVFQGDKQLQFMNSSCIFLTFQPLFISLWVMCTVHVIHKLYISATFSLKMGFTILFIHLKIILLQCFQFSVSAK